MRGALEVRTTCRRSCGSRDSSISSSTSTSNCCSSTAWSPVHASGALVIRDHLHKQLKAVRLLGGLEAGAAPGVEAVRARRLGRHCCPWALARTAVVPLGSVASRLGDRGRTTALRSCWCRCVGSCPVADGLASEAGFEQRSCRFRRPTGGRMLTQAHRGAGGLGGLHRPLCTPLCEAAGAARRALPQILAPGTRTQHFLLPLPACRECAHAAHTG